MSALPETDHSTATSVVAAVVDQLKMEPGALLPILHGIQDQLGYVPSESVPVIADALRQTSAEIHGVISFYHHFRTTPPGRNQLQICRAEACQARGSRELEQYAQSKLGIDYHQTSPDKEFSLEPVYCLGNCACGPSVRIGDEVIGRVDPARFDELVDELSTLPLEVK
ncbi:formate dehydrogenase subunit gamma [Motiliproteus sp. MSK22-1]|uniref:formate dehydrogenase subunit gamma n=1 Tax=Motiliproteus sp. MSK22-1 TaxID=1897630 RepID=UPI00097874CC|nr:formate dehydrogenase subunit gamma [Motiliproteus sp. MSK22-1]OMH39487.1 formate dehydrogenase subunit gamma [Motiliproteus sp. MSK22-1]